MGAWFRSLRGGRVAVVVSVLVAGLAVSAQSPSPAVAEKKDVAPKPAQMASVPVQQISARKHAPDKAAKAAVRQAPKVVWPRAGAADVTLSSSATSSDAVRAGSWPVWLDDATGVGEARVEIADRKATARVGIDGVLLRITPTSASTSKGATARIRLDYKDFAHAYGGDWGRRLQLLELPACAWTEPAKRGCSGAKKLRSDNDAKTSSLTGSVGFTSRAPIVVAAAAGAFSDVGDYRATSLSDSTLWTTGGSSGNFSWSYPFRAPPALGGPEPKLSVTYSSQSVDGRTAQTNNQPSWAGEGWDLASNFVERKYQPCADDGHPDKGDLCWKSDNATVSLNGKVSEIIKDDVTGNWRLATDDGSRVEKLNAANANGDNDKEYWRITTTDGVQYIFGLSALPGWAAGKAATNSVFWVPVAGDDEGEPCYNSAGFGTSFCRQAWRWMLDYVVDPNGNAMTYWYGREANYYAQNGVASPGQPYVRGGYPLRIEYGQRSDNIYAFSPPLKVAFGVASRCIPWTDGSCPVFDEYYKASYPDAPTDQLCGSTETCTGKTSPTFFGSKRLASVTTSVLRSSGYDDIDTWRFTHLFPAPGDGTDPVLWLSKIDHGGRANGGSIDLPPTTFSGDKFANRVGAPAGTATMNRWRVNTVISESGGQTRVNYLPAECVRSAPPVPESNTKRCFPSYWQPAGQSEPTLDWFHRYPVTQVVRTDLTGGGRPMLTQFSYGGGAAWHYSANDSLTRSKYRTWSDYRGYSSVTTTSGDPGDSTRSQSSALYFRGMDGDRAAPSGGTKSVDVTDSGGGKAADSDQFAGFVRETRKFNGVGGAEMSGALSMPWHKQTASRSHPWGDARAGLVRTGSTETRTTLDGGRDPRRTTVLNDFTDDGLLAVVDDRGNDATSGDDRCARTTYAQNRTAWLLEFPSRVEKVSVSCVASPARPDDIVSDVRTAYDGEAVGATPSEGNPTRTERVASYVGTTPVYQMVALQSFDSYGRIITKADADNKVTKTAYTSLLGGPLLKTVVTNPLGHTQTTSVDPAWGMPILKWDANGKRTELTYDALGRVTATWLPNRSRANSEAPNLKYSYVASRSAASAVATSTIRADAKKYNTSYALFDGFLRQRQTQKPAPGGGRVIADQVYDSRGLVNRKRADFYNSSAPSATLVTTSDGGTPALTTLSYDGLERVVSDSLITKGTPRWRTLTSYGGDRTYVDPPTGAPGTTTIKDARGNVTELWEHPSGAATGGHSTTKYAYDGADRMVKTTDADNNVWTHKYDLRGRRIETGDPDKGLTVSTYDDLDRLATSKDARGKVLAYSYDGLGRKTGLYDGSLSGTKLAAWTYDSIAGAKGLPVASIRYAGPNAYAKQILKYDSMDRPTQVNTVIPSNEGELQGTYRSDYAYFIDGKLMEYVPPDVRGLPTEYLTYYRNELGMVTRFVADPTGDVITSATYSKLGDLVQYTSPVNIDPESVDKLLDVTMLYEEGTRRLKEARADQTGKEPSSDRFYYYNDSGNVVGVKELAGASVTDELECYRYDGYQRMTEVWTKRVGGCSTSPVIGEIGGPSPYWHSFRYTNAGMRASQTVHRSTGNLTSTHSYPDAGQPRPHAVSSVVTGSTTATFGYDAAGNTTSRRNPATGAQQTLAWNTEGRLSSITEGTKTTKYLYDADGNLLIKRDPIETVLYVEQTEAHLTLASGEVTGTRYYEFDGKTVGVLNGSAFDYLITDQNNTPVVSIDSPTQTVLRRRETPFGVNRGTSSGWPAKSKSFVGGIADDTNRLVTLGARQYDPTYGRFISADSALEPANLADLTAYAYANNNPATLSDPIGLGLAQARTNR